MVVKKPHNQSLQPIAARWAAPAELFVMQRLRNREMFMKRLTMIFLLLFVCVGCDQSTKYTAKHFLEGQPTLSYMGDIFRLSYTENTGAFLSMGAVMPEKLRYVLLVVLVSIFLIVFLLFVIRNKKLNYLSVSASALIVGGGLGNLIDRIINKGSVIDFMNIGFGPIRTGIFNVADLAITAGVLMYAAFYTKKSHNQVNSADS
jgi:signal peptidase II